MKENNLSQKSLETILGFSNGSVSKWKKHTPTFDRLQKLSAYFDVSIDYLLCKTDNKKEGMFGEEVEIPVENIVKALQQIGFNAEYIDSTKKETAISDQEKRVLTYFRLLNPELKDHYLAMLEAYAKNLPQSSSASRPTDEKHE